MKKSVVIAVLGLTAVAFSSLGQGSLSFNSYTAGPSSTGVQVFNAVGMVPLAGGFTASIAWSLTAVSDAAGNGALNASLNLTGGGDASGNVYVSSPFSTLHPGYFNQANQNFILNPYTAGTTVYFEILAYNGSSYANSSVRGHSATFSSTLTTGLGLPPNMPLFSSFNVSAVPEPTTLALAGLGGLASLVALRRKQS